MFVRCAACLCDASLCDVLHVCEMGYMFVRCAACASGLCAVCLRYAACL